MSGQPRRTVRVYDPNSFNGYGRELAEILADDRDVQLYVPRSIPWVPPRPAARRVLAGPVAVDGALRSVVLRAVGPLRVAASALRHRDVLVVVWPRDVWDASVFVVASALGLRLVTVNHNPSAIRRKPGLRGRVERAMKRHAVNVVHSQVLLEPARADADDVVVVVHPPYDAWVARYVASAGPVTPHDGLRLLLLGALRPDKGVADAVRTACATTTRPTTLVVAGTGRLDAGTGADLATAGVDLDDRSTTDGLTDEQLADALRGSDAVLAPYGAATQSGAVMLALNAGVPVLGYATGALTDLLTDRSVVPRGEVEALARTVDAFVAAPWPTARVTPAEVRAECAAGWSSLLDRVEQR